MTALIPDTAQTRAAHAPIRSCAACRARIGRDGLLRFVLSEASGSPRVVVDLRRQHEGRGLSLGPSPICLARADKRGVFQRQWRRHLSSEDQAVLVAETRERLVDELVGYLTAASRRGGWSPVERLEDIAPPEARVLWEREELSEVARQVRPGAATNARIAARITALSRAVSEFTFARAGVIKRRLEPPEACEALERCGGGELRGSVVPRQRRGGAGPHQAASDGRDG